MHTRCFSCAGCKSSSQVCPSLLILSATTYVSYTIIFILLLTNLGCTFSYWFVFFQPKWLPAIRGIERDFVSFKTRSSTVSNIFPGVSALVCLTTSNYFFPPLTVASKVHMKNKVNWLDHFQWNASIAQQQKIWWLSWRSIWKAPISENMCTALSVVVEVSQSHQSFGMLIMLTKANIVCYYTINIATPICSMQQFWCNLNHNTYLLWLLGTR